MVLADGHIGAGEPEQACAIALDALRIGEQLKSVRCVSYLREFRQHLDRFRDHRAVRDLAEQAAEHRLWIAST